MKTKKENSKCLPKNDDGTDLRRLPLLVRDLWLKLCRSDFS